MTATQEPPFSRDLLAILDATPDYVSLADASRRILYINPGGLRLLGLPGGGLPAGFSVSDVHPPAALARILSEGIPTAERDGTWSGDTALKGPDGREVPVSQVIIAHRGPDGAVERYSTVMRDLRERRRAEEARAHLAAIVEGSDDAIISKSLDGVVLSWNGGAARLYGYSAEEMIGKPITTLIPPAGLNDEPRILDRVLRGERVPSFETTRRRKDGREVRVLLSVAPIRDAEGRVVAASAVARDITRRIEAEEALRRSEAKLNRAQAMARIGSWHLDLRRNELTWSAENYRIFGVPPGTELTYETFLDLVHPEDRTLVDAAWKAAMERRPYDIEHRIVGESGPRWVRERAEVEFDDAGLPLYGTGTTQDVTERKRAELALARANAYNRGLIEAALDALVTIGPDGKITDVNKATEAATGCPRSALIGSDFADYFTDPARARAGYEAVYRDGSVRDYPLELRHVDGRVTPVLYNANVYRGPDGAVAGVFAAARDVTELVRARSELQALNAGLEERIRSRTAELEAANKELEAFTYSVSHDLRAPLRTVDGFAQILTEEHGPKLDDDCRHLLARVRQGAQQMGRLIDDLLAFSRLGQRELAPADVDMADLARSALELLAPERAGRTLEVVVGDLPPCRGDAELLKQVWVNLLSNAVKFTARKAAARIEAGWREEGGAGVYFVKDDGAGFDMRYADKLFRVFQRLHRAEEFPGTGVGLAIVQRIVARHGGRVWAVGEVGKGAEVCFVLGGERHD